MKLRKNSSRMIVIMCFSSPKTPSLVFCIAVKCFEKPPENYVEVSSIHAMASVMLAVNLQA